MRCEICGCQAKDGELLTPNTAVDGKPAHNHLAVCVLNLRQQFEALPELMAPEMSKRSNELQKAIASTLAVSRQATLAQVEQLIKDLADKAVRESQQKTGVSDGAAGKAEEAEGGA